MVLHFWGKYNSLLLPESFWMIAIVKCFCISPNTTRLGQSHYLSELTLWSQSAIVAYSDYESVMICPSASILLPTCLLIITLCFVSSFSFYSYVLDASCLVPIRHLISESKQNIKKNKLHDQFTRTPKKYVGYMSWSEGKISNKMKTSNLRHL